TTLNIHKHSLSPLFSLIHRQTYKDVHTHTHTHTIIHIEYSQKHSHTPSFFLGHSLFLSSPFSCHIHTLSYTHTHTRSPTLFQRSKPFNPVKILNSCFHPRSGTTTQLWR